MSYEQEHRLDDLVTDAESFLRKIKALWLACLDDEQRTKDLRFAAIEAEHPDWGPARIYRLLGRETWEKTPLGRAHRRKRSAEKWKLRAEHLLAERKRARDQYRWGG